MRVEVDPDGGFMFRVPRFGRYLVSADGTQILCAPPRRPPWFWERFLLARALPLAATLRGYEVLHAGAVVRDGRAVGILGDRGVGKTSVSLHLVLGGARLLTDDALSLERRDGRVIAHAGASLLSVRSAEMRLLARAETPRLGTRIGSGAKRYFALEPDPAPAPLAALYQLVRTEPTGAPRVTTVPHPGVGQLMASSFISFVRQPARLARQLDVLAAISRGVPLFQVELTSGSTARDAAAALAEHAATLDAGRAAESRG